MSTEAEETCLAVGIAVEENGDEYTPTGFAHEVAAREGLTCQIMNAKRAGLVEMAILDRNRQGWRLTNKGKKMVGS